MELINDYDCTIEYHPSRANTVADALSRKFHSRLNVFYACRVPLLTNLKSTKTTLGVDYQEALLANFQIRPVLLVRVLEAQMNDLKSQELKQVVLNGNMGDLRIRIPEGMLMQGDRIYVPKVEELKKEILDKAYISAYAMHPRSTKMYHIIQPFYYWPGMKREIAEYINPDLAYDEVPVTILDWKDKVLRNKTVSMVKVLWRNHSVEEVTWETNEETGRISSVFDEQMATDGGGRPEKKGNISLKLTKYSNVVR
nr:uncharacterized protein LOC114827173 [Malus domestica]